MLVVDDDAETRELYERYLADYDVASVANGQAALDETAAGTVDIVFLDRRLQGLSGETVAAELRRRAEPPMVAIVTGVEPDLDILGIACDAYLTKPVSSEDLQCVVDRLSRRADYDDQLGEYASLAAKQATLEVTICPEALDASEEYRGLCERLDTLSVRLDGMVSEFDETDFTTAFRHPDFDTVQTQPIASTDRWNVHTRTVLPPHTWHPDARRGRSRCAIDVPNGAPTRRHPLTRPTKRGH